MRNQIGIAVIGGVFAWLGSLGCSQQRGVMVAVDDAPFEREAWQFGPNAGVKLTTEHYEIHTTVEDPRLIEAIPQALESAWQYYQMLVPVEQPLEERMRVFLFVEREEFEAFTKRFAPDRARLLLRVRGGGYTERGVAVMQYVSHSVTFPLLTHEGFHQYLYHCVNRRVPAWLNEGLAVVCEGQRWSDRGLQSFDPWYNPARRRVLSEALLREELIPLPRLLDINAGHVIGGSRRLIGKYYAQVWMFTLFLMEGAEGKYADGFLKLREALGSQDLEPFARAAFVRSGDETYSFGRALFAAFISDEIDTVEREYRAFLETALYE